MSREFILDLPEWKSEEWRCWASVTQGKVVEVVMMTSFEFSIDKMAPDAFIRECLEIESRLYIESFKISDIPERRKNRMKEKISRENPCSFESIIGSVREKLIQEAKRQFWEFRDSTKKRLSLRGEVVSGQIKDGKLICSS